MTPANASRVVNQTWTQIYATVALASINARSSTDVVTTIFSGIFPSLTIYYFAIVVGGCPLRRLETTGQLLHPAAGSNQVGCSCTWQRSLFRKTNTGATAEIPALNQSWRICNHPTSTRPYEGHQVPNLVPRTTDYLSPLWSNTDHWPYAPGVCSVTGMSW